MKQLYKRDLTYIPRVAAIHDLCGYGKCSLGVAIPVLSAGGCDVCPVPTGLFSNHTAYPNFYMQDTTDILNDYLSVWQEIGVEIDAIYSGFLGVASQVDIIRLLYTQHPHAIRFVDPVMADHGKVYPTYTPELCQKMSDLSSEADILTPNLTEAAIILGEPIGSSWEGPNISDSRAHYLVNKLLDMGAKNVILKGIQRDDGLIRNYIGGSDFDIFQVSNKYLPYMLHGTGDLYASALLAAIMTGADIKESAEFAGSITHDAMIISSKQPSFMERGVSFESLLGKVTELLSNK